MCGMTPVGAPGLDVELKENLPRSHGASGALSAFKRVFLGACMNCAHCFPARKKQNAFQHGNYLPFYE